MIVWPHSLLKVCTWWWSLDLDFTSLWTFISSLLPYMHYVIHNVSCESCWLCMISRWRHQQDLGSMSYLHTLCTPHTIHQLVATRGSCGAELVICRGPQPLTGRSMWPLYCDTLLLLFVDPSFEMDPQRSLPHLLMALRLRQRVWWWGWGRKGWWVVAAGARSRVPWGCRGVIWSWNFGIGLFVGSIVMWWRGWGRVRIPCVSSLTGFHRIWNVHTKWSRISPI